MLLSAKTAIAASASVIPPAAVAARGSFAIMIQIPIPAVSVSAIPLVAIPIAIITVLRLILPPIVTIGPVVPG